MATYHNSIAKQKNRQFKLRFAKKALRYGRKNPREVLTLCGNSAWFETEIALYAREKGIPVEVHGFNKKLPEFLEAEAYLRNVGQDLPVTLFRDTLKPHMANLASFVDFDTCGWFFGKLAEACLSFCVRAEMVAITVHVKGRHTAKELIHLPDGMKWEDARTPEEIGKWLEARSPLSHIATQVYKNDKAAATMATIIMGKKSLRTYTSAHVDSSAKAAAYRLLAAGESLASVASKTGLPLGSVRAYKARMHESFAKK